MWCHLNDQGDPTPPPRWTQGVEACYSWNNTIAGNRSTISTLKNRASGAAFITSTTRRSLAMRLTFTLTRLLRRRALRRRLSRHRRIGYTNTVHDCHVQAAFVSRARYGVAVTRACLYTYNGRCWLGRGRQDSHLVCQ